MQSDKGLIMPINVNSGLSGAIIGLRVPGVQVQDIATTAKTLPDFPGMWADLLAGK